MNSPNRDIRFANITIAHQDRRVVQTQRPFVSSLNGGENLIEGDLPIVLYRRRREQLQKESQLPTA